MSSETYSEQYGIVGTLQDGRTLAKGEVTEIVTWVANIRPPAYLQVHFPRLNIIDCILDINIKTVSPPACVHGICQKTITRHATQGYPIVGFTVTGMTYVGSGITATGVTITAEAVCVGW